MAQILHRCQERFEYDTDVELLPIISFVLVKTARQSTTYRRFVIRRHQ